MKKGHEQQMADAQGFAKELQETISKGMEKADELRKLMTKPLETKNITVNGSSCVVQMFADKVTVVLPSKEAVLDYYKNIDIKKECWYKKYFKWSK